MYTLYIKEKRNNFRSNCKISLFVEKKHITFKVPHCRCVCMRLQVLNRSLKSNFFFSPFLNPTWTGGGAHFSPPPPVMIICCTLREAPMNSKLLEFFNYDPNLPLENILFPYLSTPNVGQVRGLNRGCSLVNCCASLKR